MADELKKLGVTWLLGASGALMVWGVKVVPRDLDILVKTGDLAKLEEAFKEEVTNPLQAYENNGKKFLKFKMEISGVQVEMIGRDIFGEEHILVDFQGKKIPVNPLERELEFYEKRPDKKDRIELIRERLKEMKHSHV